MSKKGVITLEDLYATRNLYEASFLIATGCRLHDVHKESGKKVVLMIEGERIKDAVRDYYNGGLVSGKAMTDAYRMIKDRIFED